MNVETNSRLEAITGFLDFLGDALGVFAFQIYDDNKTRNDKKRSKTYIGTFDECRRDLVEANRDRFAVHVTINDTAGKRRTRQNVARVRKHFVEIDGDHTLEEIQGIATDRGLDIAWMNESSPGKFHVYFNVADDVAADLEGFTSRQKQLAKAFDGGRESVDLARVLRVPGFYHAKGAPFMVRTVFKNADASKHTMQDFDIALADIAVDTVAAEPSGAVVFEEDQTAIDRAIEHYKAFPIAISNTPNGKMDKKGNNQTFDAIAFAKDFGLDKETNLELVLKHYSPRCKPEWSADELQTLVDNVYSYTRSPQGSKHPLAMAREAFAADPITDEDVEAIRPEPKSSVELQDLSTIKPKNIVFVWPEHLAIGKHSLNAGVGGLGKSQIHYDEAARISKGDTWPDGSGRAPKGNIVLLSAEDDMEDMMVPRLLAAGADLTKVKRLKAVREGTGRKRRFNLIADLDTLYDACRELGDVVMVGIDPIGSYLGGDIDTHNDAKLRNALDPISEFASAAKVAVSSIAHFNKSANIRNAVDRVMGGAGFVNAPRAAFGFFPDPEDPKQRLYLGLKTNIGKYPMPGMKAHLELVKVGRDDAGKDIIAPHIVWDGPTDVSADEVLAAQGERDNPRMTEAMDFLFASLTKGERPGQDVIDEAKAAGITEITLKRAKQKLGVKSAPSAPNKSWIWRLPDLD